MSVDKPPAELPPLEAGFRVYPPRVNMYAETVARQIAAGRGQSPAMIWDSGALTYEALDAEIARAAAGLSALGLKRGATLLLRSRNTAPYCIMALAAFRLGAVAVMSNSLLRTDELAYILENSEARIAAAPSDLVVPLRELMSTGQLDHIVLLDDTAPLSGESRYSDLGAGVTPMKGYVDTEAMEPAFLLYSSGTTGKPKGILHAHRWAITLCDVIKWQMAFASEDVMMAPGEFSFMGTFGHGFIAPLYTGCTIALFGERASPRGILEAIQRHRVTKFFSVPTLYRRILAEPGIEDGLDLSSLQFVISSGEAMGASVGEQMEARFKFPVYEVYGVSEVQTVIGNSPLYPHKLGSIGRALPGMRLSLRDEQLQPVAPGKTGKLMIERGDPGMFLGYHKQWDKWRAAHRDQWYDTGDVMHQDEEGYFYYHGRKDDLFKSRGYFISPQEIEDVLIRHPAVAEVAVTGIPDPEYGNRIAAFVVLVDGMAPEPGLDGEILELGKAALAAYKLPKSVEFLAALPKNPVGKILRRALVS
jgi:acyl-coenzyme A synthetase/AMP-(fatty) acid ligase